MKRQISEHELSMLQAFPQSEYGKVFLSLVQGEIDEEEKAFDLSAKVSNDPIKDDWRFKLGLRAGLKRALNLPKKYINNTLNGG